MITFRIVFYGIHFIESFWWIVLYQQQPFMWWLLYSFFVYIFDTSIYVAALLNIFCYANKICLLTDHWFYVVAL